MLRNQKQQNQQAVEINCNKHELPLVGDGEAEFSVKSLYILKHSVSLENPIASRNLHCSRNQELKTFLRTWNPREEFSRKGSSTKMPIIEAESRAWSNQ